MYKLNPFCKKYIDNEYYIFPKKKTSNRIDVLELNETGNDIITLLQKKVPLCSLVHEISEIYGLDQSYLKNVENDIGIFINKLSNFGILSLDSEAYKAQETSNSKEDINIDNGQVKFAQLQKLFAEKLLPYKFFIELTYNCNLRCKHCYKTGDVNTAKETPIYLDKSKVMELLDEIDDLGAIEVYLTGGEVFLHPDIIEILYYASEKNFLTTVLTNGNKISLEVINQIKQLSLFDVRISVYGDQKCHDSFTTVKGSFEKTIHALTNLQRIMGIGTAVFVVTNENFSTHKKLTNLLKRKGIPYSINSHLTATSDGDLFPLDFRISRDQYYELFETYKMPFHGTSCSAGLSRFRITPSGDVNPCELIRNVSFGNINTETLSKIIEGERRKNFIKAFANLINKHKCNKCELQNNCTFCPASFNLEMGGYDKASPYACAMAEVKRSFAVKAMESKK